MLSTGAPQSDIAKSLNVSETTISSDVAFLRFTAVRRQSHLLPLMGDAIEGEEIDTTAPPPADTDDTNDTEEDMLSSPAA